MIGLFYIMLCWLIGNLLSHLIGGYVSGNIIGMILLFTALTLRWIKADSVRPVAKFLLGNMAIFFIPYGVGLVESYQIVLDNIWAIVIAAILSTAVVLGISGRVFQALRHRQTANPHNTDEHTA